MEKREGRGVGANVDSNPSGGEPSTERFISTRSPPLLAREHPPPPVPPPLHVRVSARGIKFGREAVSNILCSDSPLFRPLPCRHSPRRYFDLIPNDSSSSTIKGKELWREIFWNLSDFGIS